MTVIRFPVAAVAYVPPALPCDVEPASIPGPAPNRFDARILAFAVSTSWLTLIGLLDVLRAIARAFQ